MTRDNRLIINKLLSDMPRGVVLTTDWLKEHEVSEKLAWWYVKSGWFERIAGGAYLLAGDTLTWVSAISALQQQLHLPIHPAGKTALQLLGRSHYLSTHIQEIQLFAAPRIKPPTWLHSAYWQETFTVYRPALFISDNTDTFVNHEINGLTIKISSPERAVFELCYLVPSAATFSEVAQIVEGLTRMRPKLMQWLLENCDSYKVKRLVLYLADHFNHPWLTEIDLSRIDLGKGKRVIAGGGQYSAKYQISVPTLGNNT